MSSGPVDERTQARHGYGVSEPKTERFEMRVTKSWMDRLDAWRTAQIAVPTRTEAIRVLVEIGLRALEAENRPKR